MIKPNYISDSTRRSLSRREQDFLSMISERRFTKKIIMRKLYITTREGLYLLQKRVAKKIEKDVKLFNELQQKICNASKKS